MHGVLCFLAIFTLAYCADNWTPPPVCLLPKQRGPCSAQIRNFFYNPVSGRCDSFMFSGCGGNENRFRTEKSCNRHCTCHIPPEAGPCRSAMEKWFYNPTTGCCEKFTYGGCQGNSNNFQSYEECRSTCVGSAPGMVKPRGSNWGSGSEIHFETNNFYNPQKYGNKFTGSKTLWLHGERGNVMRGTQQANQIIRFVTPDLHKKEHWHFVAKQGTKGNFPQQLGQRLKITGLSSNSQTIPVGGSRMVLTGSSSIPGGTAGGQFISSGRSLSGSVPMGGSKLVMSGKTSIPMGSTGTSGGKFSQLFGTSGGSLTQGGANPMGGSKLVLSGSRSVPAGGSGRISSMIGTSGGNGMSGFGGSSLKMSGHSAGGMGDDNPSGSSFVSAHSGARHPVGMGSGFVGGISQGQGMRSGQPASSGVISRANMRSGSNSAPFPKSQISLTLPVEDVVGGSAAVGKMMKMMGGGGGGSMGGGGTGQAMRGGGLSRGRENYISANSNPWHPTAGKKK